MLAGKLIIRSPRQWFRLLPPAHIASGTAKNLQTISSKNNVPINVEIVARKVICRYVCRKFIWNVSGSGSDGFPTLKLPSD